MAKQNPEGRLKSGCAVNYAGRISRLPRIRRPSGTRSLPRFITPRLLPSFSFAYVYSRRHRYFSSPRTSHAESETNGCRTQRAPRIDGGRKWSPTRGFHGNLESRPRLAPGKTASIAGRDSLRSCGECLGHTYRKIGAIIVDRRPY